MGSDSPFPFRLSPAPHRRDGPDEVGYAVWAIPYPTSGSAPETLPSPADLLHGRLEPGHYRIRQACNDIKLPASYASPTRPALAPPPAATAPPAGRPCACTLDIGTTLPRISPTSSPDASQGARCGRRPTAARTARTRLEDKGSTKSNCSSTHWATLGFLSTKVKTEIQASREIFND